MREEKSKTLSKYFVYYIHSILFIHSQNSKSVSFR